MNAPLDELYLTWLYEEVADSEIASPSGTYWNLLRYLYETEYVWIVANDDNRWEDGRFLREEFIEDLELDVEDSLWMNLECSMLEMMVALSRRLSFLGEGEPREWFWHLIDNLGLHITDRQRFPKSRVQEVLNTVIWRTYDADGTGGLFPLQNPRGDQRKIELWVQMNSYLLERY